MSSGGGASERERGGGGRRRHREPPSAPPRPSGPPPSHPPVTRAHGRVHPAQPPGLRTPRHRPARSSAPPRPFSPGGAARPPPGPQPLSRRQPQWPRQRWGTLLSPRACSLAIGPTYLPC
ncbi:basic proline-rich protein-like [Cricetulus griseus]|uniref:basic proline-rich protein-like n=1 Tax=Cricetulus griseus TaxID=10029 RepID=UPI0015C2CB61|nr:basic proline-rich protein-like [Cricetulus griseus]